MVVERNFEHQTKYVELQCYSPDIHLCNFVFSTSCLCKHGQVFANMVKIKIVVPIISCFFSSSRLLLINTKPLKLRYILLSNKIMLLSTSTFGVYEVPVAIFVIVKLPFQSAALGIYNIIQKIKPRLTIINKPTRKIFLSQIRLFMWYESRVH